MDREKVKRYGKRLLAFVGQIAVITAVVVLVNILWDGMYLIGVPSVEDVERVTVSYPSVTDEVKEAAGEKIETAVKLTGFLKYDLFRTADESGGPLITITYFTKDGREVAVAANRETVWWKGRARAIQDGEMFVNLAEGLFFLDDLAEKRD